MKEAFTFRILLPIPTLLIQTSHVSNNNQDQKTEGIQGALLSLFSVDTCNTLKNLLVSTPCRVAFTNSSLRSLTISLLYGVQQFAFFTGSTVRNRKLEIILTLYSKSRINYEPDPIFRDYWTFPRKSLIGVTFLASAGFFFSTLINFLFPGFEFSPDILGAVRWKSWLSRVIRSAFYLLHLERHAEIKKSCKESCQAANSDRKDRIYSLSEVPWRDPWYNLGKVYSWLACCGALHCWETSMWTWRILYL